MRAMDKYQVHVTSVPPDTKRVVRAFRVIGGMSLAKAIELYEFIAAAGEIVIAAGIDRRVAEHVHKALDGAGVGARIEASPVSAPMVLDPGVDEIYEWGALQTLRRVSRG